MTMAIVGTLFIIAGILLEAEEKLLFPERYKTPFYIKKRMLRATRAWGLIFIGLLILLFSL
jgi:hypothetical protein